VLPNLPPPPVLPEHPTAAQRAEYKRLSLDYERRKWNYVLTDSTARARVLNEQPNALLRETVQGLKPGRALDVAMGEGRNTIYLARQGWQATGVDIADEAIAFAQRKAALAGAKITTVVHDVETYDWGTNAWDLIVVCYGGGREYAARVQKALKPGGLLVLEGFHRDATREHKIGEGVVFDTDELKNLYAAAGLRIVRYEEPLARADYGKYEVRLVKLVAQKPL
jgi:SAM-dependent methyltransferase